jgi:hypothetical protein
MILAVRSALFVVQLVVFVSLNYSGGSAFPSLCTWFWTGVGIWSLLPFESAVFFCYNEGALKAVV